jgi:hypothetical protein
MLNTNIIIISHVYGQQLLTTKIIFISHGYDSNFVSITEENRRAKHIIWDDGALLPQARVSLQTNKSYLVFYTFLVSKVLFHDFCRTHQFWTKITQAKTLKNSWMLKAIRNWGFTTTGYLPKLTSSITCFSDMGYSNITTVKWTLVTCNEFIIGKQLAATWNHAYALYSPSFPNHY